MARFINPPKFKKLFPIGLALILVVLLVMNLFGELFSGIFAVEKGRLIFQEARRWQIAADAAETLSPDVLLQQDNLNGAVTDIDDDPDGPLEDWLTHITKNVDTVTRVSFPTPSNNLTIGANLQNFKIWVRKQPGTGTPTVAVSLYEGGVSKGVIMAAANVTSSTGQLFTATWNANLLDNVDGSGVECYIYGDAVGGAPTAQVTVEVGAVEWNVEYDYVPVITVAATGTQTASMDIPSTNQYVGGAFTFVVDAASTNIGEIVITDTGTVNANQNIASVSLFYETAETCVYDGTEIQFASTSLNSFDTSEKASISTWGAVGGEITYTGTGDDDSPYGIAIDSDRNIYVAGFIGDVGATDWAVRKYKANGLLDTSWGTDGMVTYDSGQNDRAYGIAIDSSRNIYVAGHRGTNSNDWVIRKYTSAGALDTDWGASGMIVYDSTAGDDTAYDIVLDSSNSIYVAGWVGQNGKDLAVRKYDANGNLDTTWGTGGSGMVTYDSGGTVQMARGIAVNTSNEIYVGGHSTEATIDWVIRKYTSSGALDTDWGASGMRTYDTGVNDYIYDLGIDSSDSIYIAGYSNTVAGGWDWALAKYDANGNLATWGDGGSGKITYNSGSTQLDDTDGIAIDSDRNIYVIGRSNSRMAVRKYDANGNLVTSWGTSGMVTYSGGLGLGLDVELDSSRNIYGISVTNTPVNGEWLIIKYDASGVLDTGMLVGTSQVCVYVVVDVGAGATDGQKLDIQITETSDVTVDTGTVYAVSWPVQISGDTTLGAAEATISGNCKQANQSTFCATCNAPGCIKVARNETLDTGTAADIDGSGNFTYTFTTNPSANDIITVFKDNQADANEAVGVTKYDGLGNITGVQLYESHLSIGSDDTGVTITNTNLGLYDVTDDEDVFHKATVTSLDICGDGNRCDDLELYIKSGSTYQPNSGGSSYVKTHDIEIDGTFDMTGTGNYASISGGWDNDYIFTAGTSTIFFTASASAEIVSASVNDVFYNVQFGDSATSSWSGSWSLGGTMTGLDINGNLAIDGGTLAPGSSYNINLAGDLLISDKGAYTKNSGTFTFDKNGTQTWTDNTSGQDLGTVSIDGDGSATTVNLGSSVKATTINVTSSDTFSANGSNTLTLSSAGASVLVVGGTFTASTGTVVYQGTGATTVLGLTDTNRYYNLSVGLSSDTGTFSYTAGGEIQASGSVSLIAGSSGVHTFDMGSNNLSVGGGTADTGGITVPSGTVFTQASGTTKVYSASGTATIGGAGTTNFYNFQIGNASDNATYTFTLAGEIGASGSFTNTAGGTGAHTLALSSYEMGVWTDFTIGSNASLSAQTGLLTFSGAGNTAYTNSGSSEPYNLTINKTGTEGNDLFTLASNLLVRNLITITDGHLVQGNYNVTAEGSSAVSVETNGEWRNIGDGDLTLGGSFDNAGSVSFDTNDSGCTNVADDIQILSTVNGTQRTWSGTTGTWDMYNVYVKDMTRTDSPNITVYDGSSSNVTGNWTFDTCAANEPPAAPTLAETPAFANMQTNDTTPELGNFKSADPESDNVEYECQWDEDYSFGSLASTSVGPMVHDTWTSCTVPTALTNGTTYWWRVKARDPSGSNTWSSYSGKRSISINTSLILDRWFQTTDEQFNTGTLTDTVTNSPSGQVKLQGFSPFLYVYQNNQYVFFSDFLGRAGAQTKEYTDFINLTNKTDVVDGKIKLKITEEMDETAYIDQIYLLVDGQGIIYPSRMSEANFALIRESDDKYLVMEKGDEFYLEFNVLENYSKIEFAAEGYYIVSASQTNNAAAGDANWVVYILVIVILVGGIFIVTIFIKTKKKRIGRKIITFLLIFLIMTGWLFSNWPILWQIAAAADLPSELRPVTPDGTLTNVLFSSGTVAWSLIDDDPDNPDTADYIYETGNITTTAFLNITNMPADFSSMDTLWVKIYLDNTLTWADDTSTLYAQMFQSNESSTLSDEMQLATQVTADGVINVQFTNVVASNKTTWDDARLRFRWVNVKTGGPDGDYLQVAAAELTGTYTGGDVTDPTVDTLSPADNATGVATSSNLVITFSEAVDAEAGVNNDIVIKKTSDDSTVETIDSQDAKVSGSGGTTITINPDTTLAEQTGYYVQIGADAFDDAAGNSYAGISDTISWNFTTADETNPTVDTLSPADNATNVAVDSNLVITFSEAVDAEAGVNNDIVIKKTSDDSTVETIDSQDAKVSGSGGTTITINPDTTLAEQTGYYVQIGADAFDDAAGNSYAGISDTISWNFTTVAAEGTIMSPEIDFDWVTGQSTWGTAAFSTTETNGDVKLRVYYTVSIACDTIVPDGTLSGNSTGFDVTQSPINISGLTPATHNRICLQATLTSGVGGTPFLNDWTVTWGAVEDTLTLTIDAGSSVNFGTVSPGSQRVTGTTRIKVDTNSSDGYEVFVGRDRENPAHTLASSANPASYYINDTEGGLNVFDGISACTSTDTWPAATGASSGLGFTIWAADINKDTTCWGTGSTESDSSNEYATLEASSSAPLILDTSSNSPNPSYASIGWSLEVKLLQDTTGYTGDVIITATTKP